MEDVLQKSKTKSATKNVVKEEDLEQTQETVVEESKPVIRDEIYTATFLKLLEKVEKLESERENKAPTENKAETPNEVLAVPDQPRRIVFQIKGMVYDDAMKDGAYIPGKSYGVSKHKNVSELLNINEEIFEPSLDRWKTGFEIEDVLYSSLPEEIKQQRIKDIKTARAWCEYKLRQSLSDNNRALWSKKTLEISDLGKVYDTSKDINNLILYYNILGGGYPEVAPSYDAAKLASKNLYLTVYEEEAKRQMAKEKVIFKAFGKLEDLDENWSLDDCLYLFYSLDKNKEHGFTLSTPKDIILSHLHSFIIGTNEDEKKKKPKEFLDAIQVMAADPQYIKIKATFNAASYYGFIVSDKGVLMNKQTGFNYGSSMDKAIEKLLDPRNIEELGYINGKVREKWLK